MSNPFQEQFLKAGLVSQQQVKKAQQDKSKQHKQKPKQPKKAPVVDEAKLKARQLAEEQANRARELNIKKEEQARQKALSAEINQLIKEHYIKRDDNCDIAYNFEHNGKVKHIYINAEMKQQIINGKLGIARIEGRYELVPQTIAEKIQQRNEKRIVLFKEESQTVDENDPYAAYQIPDDLMW